MDRLFIIRKIILMGKKQHLQEGQSRHHQFCAHRQAKDLLQTTWMIRVILMYWIISLEKAKISVGRHFSKILLSNAHVHRCCNFLETLWVMRMCIGAAALRSWSHQEWVAAPSKIFKLCREIQQFYTSFWNLHTLCIGLWKIAIFQRQKICNVLSFCFIISLHYF